MRREIRLTSGEVVRYEDRDKAWWEASGGSPVGRPPAEAEAEWKANGQREWRGKNPERICGHE